MERPVKRLTKSIDFLGSDTRAGADTSLTDLSGRLGVSEFHLQRVFGEWAGVSPKRFMQFISKERALAAADVEPMLAETLICVQTDPSTCRGPWN